MHNVPQVYATLLESAQTARRVWERSASSLLDRERDLAFLRVQLSSPTSDSSRSRYDSLCTERLVAQRDSQYQDLLRGRWKHVGGRPALHFLIDLAGLQSASTLRDPSEPSRYQITATTLDVKTTPSLLPAPPLPIAAAHHPANLRSLSEPLFSAPTESSPAPQDDGAALHATPTVPRAVSERLDRAAHARQALHDALARTEAVRQTLSVRLPELQAAFKTMRPETQSTLPDLKLWKMSVRHNVCFETPPAPARPKTFSHHHSRSESALEERIAQIRMQALPAYPSVPAASAPAGSSPLPVASSFSDGGPANKLRQPSQKGAWYVDAIETKKQLAVPERRLPAARKPIGQNIAGPAPPDRAPKVTMPGKVSRRVSAARTRRSTLLFRQDGVDDEVDKIVETIENGSPWYEGSTAIPGSRARLLGAPSSMVKSFRRTNAQQIEASVDKRDSPPNTDDKKPMYSGAEHSLDDEPYYEGHSVTLRDILIKAGTGDITQLNLMEGDDEPEDETFQWD